MSFTLPINHFIDLPVLARHCPYIFVSNRLRLSVFLSLCDELSDNYIINENMMMMMMMMML